MVGQEDCRSLAEWDSFLQHHGQIYIPFICYLLGGLCVILVATFKTSAQLTKAYGLAVNIDMLLTTHFATLVRNHTSYVRQIQMTSIEIWVECVNGKRLVILLSCMLYSLYASTGSAGKIKAVPTPLYVVPGHVMCLATASDSSSGILPDLWHH